MYLYILLTVGIPGSCFGYTGCLDSVHHGPVYMEVVDIVIQSPVKTINECEV